MGGTAFAGCGHVDRLATATGIPFAVASACSTRSQSSTIGSPDSGVAATSDDTTSVMLGRVFSSGTPTSGCTSRYSLSPDHPALTPWCTRVTGVPGSVSSYSSTMSSGYIRTHPWLTRMPMLKGLLVPWMRYWGNPRYSACDPSGLSGPGPTTRGSGSPFLAASSRIDSGGYHVGRTFFLTMLVSPSGVSQPDPTNADRPCTHDAPALRIVVDPHLRDIDHQTGTRRLGKYEPRRQSDGGSFPGKPHIHPGIGKPKLREPHPESSRDVQQCVLVPCNVDLIASHHGIFCVGLPYPRPGRSNGNRHGDGNCEQPADGQPHRRSRGQACNRIDDGRTSHVKRIATAHPCRPRVVPGTWSTAPAPIRRCIPLALPPAARRCGRGVREAGGGIHRRRFAQPAQRSHSASRALGPARIACTMLHGL